MTFELVAIVTLSLAGLVVVFALSARKAKQEFKSKHPSMKLISGNPFGHGRELSELYKGNWRRVSKRLRAPRRFTGTETQSRACAFTTSNSPKWGSGPILSRCRRQGLPAEHGPSILVWFETFF